MDQAKNESLPRITVITPVLNGVGTIEETIKSVIDQPYPKLDYIVVDGGSPDGTLDIVRQYATYITRWVSKPDAGVYDGMNTGWAMAAEDSFILVLGAGDRILSLPVAPETYVGADVLYGNVEMGKHRVFLPRSDWHLRVYNSLHHQALLVRKAFHMPPPYDLRFKTYADFDFNQRLLKNGAAFRYSENFRGFALPGGISDSGTMRESIKIITKNFGLCWACLAVLGYLGTRLVPPLKKLRPFADLTSGTQ